MTQLRADGKHFQLLNEEIHACMDTDIELTGCMGQRYIASGLSGKHLRIHGIPGNALGAYADGCTVEVFGNAQDATGYAMRGGSILVEGNVGYRAGIHMKAYKDQIPVLVIGGEAGSFLGEYQAGGINLLYFLSCAPAALISHRKNGLIEREAVKCCVPAGVVTSVLSALLAARVDTDLLRRAFGVVLLYIGVKETFLRKK